MDPTLLAVLALIAVALVFDYINGFHDAANSIATVVSTRVLSPGKAVDLGGVLQFRRRVRLRHRGRADRRRGMVDLSVVTFTVIFAGLIGAIVWDLITWYYGLPTSSSHALFGGYARRRGGQGRLRRDHRRRAGRKTLIFIVLAPLDRHGRRPRC